MGSGSDPTWTIFIVTIELFQRHTDMKVQNPLSLLMSNGNGGMVEGMENEFLASLFLSGVGVGNREHVN